jgi:hypothetical protein
MDPAIRGRWTAALRSGETPQARGKLRDGEGRCCFGVLCDLAVEDGVIGMRQAGDTWLYDERERYISPRVQEWAGLTEFNLKVTIRNRFHPLAWHNDNGVTFAQIADAIDGKQPEVTG